MRSDSSLPLVSRVATAVVRNAVDPRYAKLFPLSSAAPTDIPDHVSDILRRIDRIDNATKETGGDDVVFVFFVRHKHTRRRPSHAGTLLRRLVI